MFVTRGNVDAPGSTGSAPRSPDRAAQRRGLA
jgi:hypothetical protein